MWVQMSDPMHHVALSALAAAAPILLLFALLLSRRVSGHVATIITLVAGFFVAIAFFTMPPELAAMSGLYGVAFGLFPIGWIVFNAVFLYKLSVKSGGFKIVRDSIETITEDRRIQAILIAFCLGAFLEGAAGFGAPVAITAGMLAGLGFDAFYAAGICLIANTAPVAFGGIGIPVITAGVVAGIDPDIVSKMIAHQLPLIALIIPLWLVVIIAGWRGARQIWPVVAVAGISYAITMFLTASYLGPGLPDILSSVVSMACVIVLLRFWQPGEVWRFPSERSLGLAPVAAHHTWSDLLRAWTPFILLIIFVSNWGSTGIHKLLETVTIKIPWGTLDGAIIKGGAPLSVSYPFAWLGAAGTAILLAAALSAILLAIPWREFWRTMYETLIELRKPLITIGTIVGFAFIANYSGMSLAIGSALTTTGYFFPLIAPLIGWLGVFITGSDTSSNALFSSIQSSTAYAIGVDPVLTVAANSSGGVAAKMISPQSIAVATAAVALTGQEGRLFRFTILHSIGLVAIISVITYLQAYYLTWMIPAQGEVLHSGTAHFDGGSMALVALSLAVLAALAIVVPRLRASTTRAA